MFNWLSKVLRPRAPHLESIAIHNDAQFFPPEIGASHGRLYQTAPWVYVAVNRIAEAAALTPLKVYRLEGEQRVEVERHPLETLLECPNPYLSRFELLEQTLGMLELTGNAYWFLVGDAAGSPVEIWPLRPERVSIVPDKARFVRGYVYELDGQRIPMDAVEVVHFKRWHPENDYYGFSALAAARLAIQTDRAMADWNRNTFGKDNGVPAGIVTINDFISDSDFERIKREWRTSYGGPQRKTAFLRGGGITWQDIGLSHTDMDFLKGREANRDEILNIFGVPVGLLSDNATEANAKVAERSFVERTLWPKLVRIAQKITQDVLPFWPGRHVAEFVDIRPTDVQARLDEIKTAYPVLSINEIRARYYALPPVAWGGFPVGALQQEISVLLPQDTASSDVPDDTAPDEQAEAVTPEETKRAILTELDQWERFALKRLDKPNPRPFETQHLPEDMAFELRASLAALHTADDVKALFAALRARLEGESPEGHTG
ncbi:MAG: hypothetical protein OHK0046_10120 [Anaerolineae bacterium]